jgi:predicted RNA binding protein with dsRBD fold (UPF0201 family)
MIQVTMSDSEAAVLTTVLEQVIPALRMEIADTEQMEFREDLKKREAILKKILEMLVKAQAPAKSG